MLNTFPGYSQEEIAVARQKVKKLAKAAESAIKKSSRQILMSTMEEVENYYNIAPNCCREDLRNILFDLGTHLANAS